MRSLLSEFARRINRVYTVIVVDEEGTSPPHQHKVRPRNLLLALGGGTLLIALAMVCLIVLTPLRELIPGYGTGEIRQDARLNALRLAALQDSLAVQQEYVKRLQRLVMGEVDSSLGASAVPPDPGFSMSGEPASIMEEPSTEHWEDHAQPAVSITRLPAELGTTLPTAATIEARLLPSLRLPALPPVNGIYTRGFDARSGHFAVDIAVQEGSVVRSVGDGYVIFADWTYEGGYAIAVQHANGYVSIYKHNQRLLKRVGDQVRDREAIATSGNTGEVTTGPHLHFELWRDGLAQDPRTYLIGS